LQDLTDWASNALILGKSEEEIMLDLYDQPAFKTRFAGMFARQQAGYPPISIDSYLEYEDMAASLGTTWGMKLSKAEVDNLVANNVSARELEQRFTIAATAVYEDDSFVRDQLTRLFGVNQENLMRYWMDPKATLGTLQQQYKMGEIAGAAMRTGFGQITANQAERLQGAGVTEEAANSGFADLRKSMELFTPLDEGEDVIGVDDQIGVLAGDANALAKVESRQARRKAEFEGTGGYATSQEGFSTGTAR
jgi:hypothetical protein